MMYCPMNVEMFWFISQNQR